ncbi:GAF domain-containing sensor histidine kinase [Pseudoalteromonas pernae]|uniref:GAF domain-containing sensor histidine kinase n=1 Tax=Pseudoalteromonas pernae TaxID=3118054 RepID=UPI00324240C8
MKESLAKVTVRGVEQAVEVPIMEFADEEFQSKIFEQWQRVLDLIAQIYDIPAALVMRLHEKDIEVFAKSNCENNPYHENETAALGSGLYCETVVGTDSQFEVENALEDERWHDNPDVPLNMISYLGVPLKWPDGEVFGTICVLDSKSRKFHDLNKQLLQECRKTLEKDLEMIVKNNQLNASLALLKRTQEKVIEMERSKLTSSLVSNIAHEINTPLGIALTTASALEHIVDSIDGHTATDINPSEFKAQLLEFTTLLSTSLNKTKSLMESYKKVAQDQSKGVKEWFNLSEHLLSLATILSEQLQHHDIQCEIVCPTDITLNTYGGLLSQVLESLIKNTMEHAFSPSQRGKITLVCAKHTDNLGRQSVLIEYRDSGKGINKAHVEDIFQPFFTLESNSGQSGMGLSIARDITEKSLNGQLHCEAVNHGAKFVISLPVQEPI